MNDVINIILETKADNGKKKPFAQLMKELKSKVNQFLSDNHYPINKTTFSLTKCRKKNNNIYLNYNIVQSGVMPEEYRTGTKK